MARRKKELLEILRARKDSEGAVSSQVSQGRATPDTVPSQSKHSPSLDSNLSLESFPWAVTLLVFGLLSFVIWWAIGVETGTSSGPVTESSVANTETKNLEEPKVVTSPYSILTITYQPGQIDRARQTALFLRDQANFPNVLALATPKDDPKFYQIWVGESAREEDLESLLVRVQSTEMPERVGVKPFASARIQRRSRYQQP